jgi:hypothetical protein
VAVRDGSLGFWMDVLALTPEQRARGTATEVLRWVIEQDAFGQPDPMSVHQGVAQ